MTSAPLSLSTAKLDVLRVEPTVVAYFQTDSVVKVSALDRARFGVKL